MKLADKFGDSTRIGGKGVARRKVWLKNYLIQKVKKVVKSTVTNDNQLIHVLRKSGAQPVPGIDEVNFFKDDNSIIHFERPEGLINY